MNSIIFPNIFWIFFQNSLTFFKIIVFEKKFKTITKKLLVQSTARFLSMIWNFVSKPYLRFVLFLLFSKTKIKIEKIHIIYTLKILKFFFKRFCNSICILIGLTKKISYKVLQKIWNFNQITQNLENFNC